ncbi:MAG TPA: iron-containing redox enzyme family protein [Solirubrobacteraceae bacterium]|jgi:pyrroloquinoline-quinone synthase
MDVLARLDETRAAINVLEHPFYRRWSAGELADAELGLYAGEYAHAVRALADASMASAAAAPARHAAELRAHALEEAAHVSLWDQFASAAGAPGAPGAALPETEECVRAWTAGEDLLEHLAVLYAIEAGQPEISETKLEGLRTHYGYSAEGPATEYFSVHALRDLEHARDARELIAELSGTVPGAGGQLDRMVRRASAALRGNWSLLDGVERRAHEA